MSCYIITLIILIIIVVVIKARRTAEIAGLKDALEILESETALVQRSVRRMRGVARH